MVLILLFFHCTLLDHSVPFRVVTPLASAGFRLRSPAEQSVHTLSPALGTQPGTASGVTRFFVALPSAHFLFESASLDQFTEATNRHLYRFIRAKCHLDHVFHLSLNPSAMPHLPSC